MSETEIKVLSPKLFVIDSEILDRFQDRVSRVEFVRSASPPEFRTILHLSPVKGAQNA